MNEVKSLLEEAHSKLEEALRLLDEDEVNAENADQLHDVIDQLDEVQGNIWYDNTDYEETEGEEN